MTTFAVFSNGNMPDGTVYPEPCQFRWLQATETTQLRTKKDFIVSLDCRCKEQGWRVSRSQCTVTLVFAKPRS